MRTAISSYGADLVVGFRREEAGRLVSYIRVAPGRRHWRLTCWIRLRPQAFRDGPRESLRG